MRWDIDSLGSVATPFLGKVMEKSWRFYPYGFFQNFSSKEVYHQLCNNLLLLAKV